MEQCAGPTVPRLPRPQLNHERRTDALAQQCKQQIAPARPAVMVDGRSLATDMGMDGGHDRCWIARSWRRCLGTSRATVYRKLGTRPTG